MHRFTLAVAMFITGGTLFAQTTIVPSAAKTRIPGHANHQFFFGTALTGFKNEGHTQVLYSEKDMGGSVLTCKNMADIRSRLFASPRDKLSRRRLSAKVTRLLQRLHVHQLIAKIPRSRRWRLSSKGRAITAAVINLHDEALPNLISKQVA